jgi:hypothetical protein
MINFDMINFDIQYFVAGCLIGLAIFFSVMSIIGRPRLAPYRIKPKLWPSGDISCYVVQERFCIVFWRWHWGSFRSVAEAKTYLAEYNDKKLARAENARKVTYITSDLEDLD